MQHNCECFWMQHNSRLPEINWVTDSTSKSLRETLAKIDPENNDLRWGATTQRGKYQVPWPNSLWHLDGHQPLIRWKLVIHGCMHRRIF